MTAVDDIDMSGHSDGSSVLSVAERCLSHIDGISIAFDHTHPSSKGRYAAIDHLPLSDPIRNYLQQQFPAGLYLHQTQGLASALQGTHTIMATPTSSGKSLVFSIPVLQAICDDPKATSLFVYPQKALANDQLGKLEDMYDGVFGHPAADHVISRYDGATPDDDRRQVRQRGQLVLTNPDMVHLSLLQYRDKWTRFFQNLRYVIIDEAHEYRGIFGSSVAYILRRLRCVAKQCGANPVFISASATMKDAPAHLRELTGLDFHQIGPDVDGSVKGNRRMWLLKTDEHHLTLGRRLTQLLVKEGLSCLTFCGSRIVAERLADDIPDGKKSDDSIRVYRAGLAAHEREEIEADLKSGRVKGVFCTSALELGIDIGALDAVICIGLPSTMMALWQRAGRVGRAGKDGAIFFIAADTPLDSYYVENPNDLFGLETEPLAVNLQNRRLLCHHLACAIDEAGDESLLNFNILGDDARHAIELRRENRLNHEVFYSSERYRRTPIRSTDNISFSLLLGDTEIGEIDYWHMLREAYPHAIYLHGGRRYRVKDVFRSRQNILLAPERSPNRTTPVVRKSVTVRRPRRVTQYDGLVIMEADIDVTERLVAVQEKKRDGTTLRDFQGHQGVPPYRLPTEGLAIQVGAAVAQEMFRRARHSDQRALCGVIERLMGGLFPAVVGPCDRMDYDTFNEAANGGVSFYLYDRVHDGIDLTTLAFSRVGELFRTARDRVVACDCKEAAGCFRCIRNPESEDVITKDDCVRALDFLVDTLGREPLNQEVFVVDVLAEATAPERKCAVCGHLIDADARFCSECGERVAEV